MAEPRPADPTPERYDETRDPHNPPNVMVNSHTRNLAFWSYVGPLLAFCAIVAVGLVYWLSRGPVAPDPGDVAESQSIGTAGERSPATDTPGGGDPAPRPNSAADEVRFRGGDSALRTLEDVAESAPTGGQRVALDNAEIESVRGNTFIVRDGDTRVYVIAPSDNPELRAGRLVDIVGQTERGQNGQPQVRASEVNVN